MKIVVIPETEEEKRRFQIAEHEHVSDFLLFGKKMTAESGMTDFHDWRGAYRYISTNLEYFMNEVKEVRMKEITKELIQELLQAQSGQTTAPGAGFTIPAVQPQVNPVVQPQVIPVSPVVQPPVAPIIPSAPMRNDHVNISHIEPVVMAPGQEDNGPDPVVTMEKND